MRRGAEDLHTGNAQAGAVLLEQFQPFEGRVVRVEPAFISHELGDVAQFAARRGAQVQDPLAGRRTKLPHSQKCARVLDIKQALLEARKAVEGRMGLQLEDQIFLEPIAADEIVIDVFLAPLGQQAGGICFKRVYAGKGFGRRIIPSQQTMSLLWPEALGPALDQPFRMGKAKMRLSGAQFGQQQVGGRKLTQVSAQQGINESGLWTKSHAFGQLDSDVDRGMAGNAVQPEDLVQADAEQILEGWLLGAVAGLASDEPIECGLPANHSIDQFLAQMPVARREARRGQ